MMMRSNCLIFALSRWCGSGGYLIVRKSRFGWWPHFLWSPSLDAAQVESFVPIQPVEWDRLRWWQRVLPVHTVLFRGRIQVGD